MAVFPWVAVEKHLICTSAWVYKNQKGHLNEECKQTRYVPMNFTQPTSTTNVSDVPNKRVWLDISSIYLSENHIWVGFFFVIYF